MRKTTTQSYYISNSLQENQQKKYIPGIFWTSKSKLQIILAVTDIAPFLHDSNNFFIRIKNVSISLSDMYPYLFLLFSHFVFLFSPSLSYTSEMKHVLQFTVIHTISLQTARNITEIKNTSQSTMKEKV